jgi:hypothetical protein
MAPQAIAGIANIGLSALPLFFGENNIFSGKARQANRELEKNFRTSQSMQLPGEYTEAMQNIRSQANAGMPSAALGLYQQQAGRQQAAQLGALGSRRSALAGIGNIAQAGQDAALNLAAMQGQALQTGQQKLNSALMQMGGLQYQEQLRKQQEAADYWGGRKAESNAAISGALSAVGQAAGSALAAGAFDKVGGAEGGMNPRQAARYAQNLGTSRGQFAGLMSGFSPQINFNAPAVKSPSPLRGMQPNTYQGF